MNVLYTVHSNFEHCNVSLDGKVFSYNKLLLLFDKSKKEYKKNQKLILKKKRANIEEFKFNYANEKFTKSNLSEEELKEFFYSKKKTEAKSWLSSLRRKRKSGKLTQTQVDLLNDLGMLWNPSKDIWEKYFILFQSDLMKDVLTYMNRKEWSISNKKINDLIELEKWVVNQQFLFKCGTISKENLKRLNSINFPFDVKHKENTLTIVTLIRLISKIRELRIEYTFSGIKSIAKRYKINEKVYVGAPIKISEELITTALIKEEEEDYENLKKWNQKQENQESTRKSNALAILKDKSNPYFFKYVDKICKHKPLSWNQKNIVDSNGEKLFSDVRKKLEEYEKLKQILENTFLFPKTSLNNVVYESVYLDYEFNDEVKKYAANKMIGLLNDYLLNSGILNYKKRFKPITYLMDIYKKENNVEGLLRLKELIDNHEILNVLYKDRLLNKLNKVKG